jgi:ABC-type lipoprotein export system ATPase subunit
MIKAEGIYKNYGTIKVIEDVNLTANRGELVCVLGKSGCGKSTLLKLLALITKPDKGSIFIDGTDTTKIGENEADKLRTEKIAYSFQEPLLLPYLTALENITEVTGAAKHKAAEILSDLGLSERVNHHPSRLSGGEKKRVDLARAIIKKSPILVTDEPLSNLDPDAGSSVMKLLGQHAENGGVVIYSSVEPSGAKFANRIINMD